jgi:hypothetical protein
MIVTFNAFHLGDNLVHLHFMRACAKAYPSKEFAHYANPQHTPQLQPLVSDISNLKLLDTCPENAINAWRGADDFWYLHSERNDFTRFHCDWFAHLARKMGLDNPVCEAEEMQFDYPALAPAPGTGHSEHSVFDYLLINSIPHSGQLRSFNTQAFTLMAKQLVDRGAKVITTFPTGVCDSTHDGSNGLSVTAIGRLSTAARTIIGCVTGPSWPCMNIWNRGKRFIWMLDNERVQIMPDTKHVRTCEEALSLL